LRQNSEATASKRNQIGNLRRRWQESEGRAAAAEAEAAKMRYYVEKELSRAALRFAAEEVNEMARRVLAGEIWNEDEEYNALAKRESAKAESLYPGDSVLQQKFKIAATECSSELMHKATQHRSKAITAAQLAKADAEIAKWLTQLQKQ
jgi:hypothetical protein